MADEGFIKIFRLLKEWRWYKDQNTKGLFIHCLLSANFKDGEFENITIKRGQFVTSYPKLSSNMGLSVQTIRTCINRLKSTGEITVKTTSKFSIMTVNNYEKYQGATDSLTVSQQATNSQVTVNQQQYKNVKKEKNNKNVKKSIYARAENVILSDEEYQKLIDQYGQADTDRLIEILDNYKGSSGKKYKSDYRAILNWVVDRLAEEKKKPKQVIKKSQYDGKEITKFWMDKLMKGDMD